MAVVGDSFIEKLIDEAYGLLRTEVVLLSGAASEIECLHDTFRSIQLVMADADRRRIEELAVNKWLMDMKDVMYDADDILDECRIKAEKYKLLSSASFFSQFSPDLLFGKLTWGYHIKKRIQNLNARLSDISDERSKFGFAPNLHHSPPQFSRKTSHLSDLDIVGSGIEEDKNNLVDLLTMEGFHGIPRVGAIVGMGGIGKTTLARLIFNDERITASFHTKLWVSITQDFTDLDLLKSIAAQLFNQYPEHWRTHLVTNYVSRDVLEPAINEIVRTGRCFIVLDDIWSERVWCDLLQRTLHSREPGSRVLITTRNMSVAEKVGAIDIHSMRLMSPEDGWGLLRKKVTFTGHEDEIKSLKDIGLEIVKKCGGLPLAIKAIGGVICGKAKRREWEAVLQHTNWSINGLPEGVHAALYLSYENLPSHLKECFLYICLFPLAPFFGKQKLIQYWIAEGFVKGQGGHELEELGEGYYHDLLQRGLLQPDPNSYDYNTCMVHQLYQSLARFLARDESFVEMQHESWKIGDTSKRTGSSISIKPRRLSTRISEGRMKVMLDFAQKNAYLRTILLRSSKMNIDDLQCLVNTATRLRVLDLRWSSINELPDSIGSLIHLRLLILNDTTIKEIPESIGDLVSLQYLCIQGCKYLCELPNGISKLKLLRCLDLSDTEVKGIPRGIANLQIHLNVLEGFILNNDSNLYSTLTEVRFLTNLRRLTIHKLEQLLEEVTISDSVLRDKLRLEFLELTITRTSRRDYTDEEIEKIEEIYEVMFLPPPGIEILIVKGFFGRKLPSWFAFNDVNPFLLRLRRLELYDCDNLEQLPPLGVLPNLDYLEVARAAIKTIGNEFLGQSSSKLFPKLNTLIFTGMYECKEWKWDIGGNHVFPQLHSLELNYCTGLRSLPVQLCGGTVPLENLHIKSCNSFGELSGFPTLKKLILTSSYALRFFGFGALEVLIIDNSQLRSLPDWICQAPPTLKKLIMFPSFELFQKCFKDGPDWPKIQHIPYVHVQYKNIMFGRAHRPIAPARVSQVIARV